MRIMRVVVIVIMGYSSARSVVLVRGGVFATMTRRRGSDTAIIAYLKRIVVELIIIWGHLGERARWHQCRVYYIVFTFSYVCLRINDAISGAPTDVRG